MTPKSQISHLTYHTYNGTRNAANNVSVNRVLRNKVYANKRAENKYLFASAHLHSHKLTHKLNNTLDGHQSNLIRVGYDSSSSSSTLNTINNTINNNINNKLLYNTSSIKESNNMSIKTQPINNNRSANNKLKPILNDTKLTFTSNSHSTLPSTHTALTLLIDKTTELDRVYTLFILPLCFFLSGSLFMFYLLNMN